MCVNLYEVWQQKPEIRFSVPNSDEKIYTYAFGALMVNGKHFVDTYIHTHSLVT